MRSTCAIITALVLALLFMVVRPASAAPPPPPEAITLPPGTSPQVVKDFNEASQLLLSGQTAQAAEKLASVVVALPELPEAHTMYGTALLKLGKTQQALEELEKANKLKPNTEVVLMNLGVGYQTLGRTAEGLKQFQKYMELYPKGLYAKNVSAIIGIMKTEAMRTQGIESSKGKDNYLSEALALGASRWEVASMPVKVFIADGKGVGGYRDECRTILEQAFNNWAAATEGKIKLEFVSDPNAAAIDCRWTDTPKDLINPAEGGQALVFPDANGHIRQIKMQLLTCMPESKDPMAAKVLNHISLHEVGHSLGLLGHSSGPEDIMFSSVSFVAPLEGLSERDKKTIHELYFAPESLLAEKKVNLSKAALAGNSNPLNEAIKLNTKGLEQLHAKQVKEAVITFEKARSLAPGIDAILTNLAGAYATLGNEELRAKDLVHCQEHYRQAAELFKKVRAPELEKSAYEALARVARQRGNQAEATKYDNAAKALIKAN